MKVIGAGLPRTGTMSMRAALNRLGYPCYHMEVVSREPSHVQAWDDLISGRATIDWQTFFREYEATADAPACFYLKELLQEFPEAKVILTVRDAEQWYESIMMLVRLSSRVRPLGYVIPKLGRYLDLTFAILDKFMPGYETHDKGVLIQIFDEHSAAVKRLVPQDRLLVFQVKEGWEPLCTFLGCEIPQDMPFPHLNAGGATLVAKMHEIFPVGKVLGSLIVASVLVLGFLVWYIFFR